MWFHAVYARFHARFHGGPCYLRVDRKLQERSFRVEAPKVTELPLLGDLSFSFYYRLPSVNTVFSFAGILPLILIDPAFLSCIYVQQPDHRVMKPGNTESTKRSSPWKISLHGVLQMQMQVDK